MRIKGVCYDVGREMMGQNWRPDFAVPTIRRELQVIRRDLHCTAVRLQGKDLERLATASRIAIEEGLEVWFSPELWDQPPDATVEYLEGAARVAQGLLQSAPGRVVLSVGSELLLFAAGFVPGENVLERLSCPRFREIVRDTCTQASLRAFVARLADAARHRFEGPLTYASLGMERVDWAPFDYVGVDLYRGDPMFDQYPELLRRYTSLGRPFVNMEFGCCTFRGAERLGGRGWEVVDWSRKPPGLKGTYVYDQGAQARELSALLNWNEEAGAAGTFVFTFVETGAGVPSGVDSEAEVQRDFDPDLPRYALVRNLPKGARGTAYPDLPWEPKEAFRAVADFYAAH